MSPPRVSFRLTFICPSTSGTSCIPGLVAAWAIAEDCSWALSGESGVSTERPVLSVGMGAFVSGDVLPLVVTIVSASSLVTGAMGMGPMVVVCFSFAASVFLATGIVVWSGSHFGMAKTIPTKTIRRMAANCHGRFFPEEKTLRIHDCTKNQLALLLFCMIIVRMLRWQTLTILRG